MADVETLEYAMREIHAHLATFPNDKYALEKMALVAVALRRARREEAPPMSNMVSDLLFHDLSGKPKTIPMVLPFKDVTDEWKFGNARYKGEGDGATRFTFGADYEMDQRWLDAERAKTRGVREEQRTLPQPTHTAEPDKMMFPTMAFNLTSMYNINYGTSRY